MRTLIGRASACLELSLGAAELRLSAGVYRPGRTRRVASADGSLTMIIAKPQPGAASDTRSGPQLWSCAVQGAKAIGDAAGGTGTDWANCRKNDAPILTSNADQVAAWYNPRA